MERHARLGEFLQVRRSQLTPDGVGLPDGVRRRRVPGLRREELAMLAGVSVGYYTRLEQGQSQNASVQVLDAIADALQLDAADRTYLHSLATPVSRSAKAGPPPDETASADLLTLLGAMTGVPAVVLGRRNDVLAWNPLGHALLAGHLDVTGPSRADERPNMSKVVFLDPHTRDLYVDWDAKARAVAGNLRLAAGRHPHDRDLLALIGELTVASPDFAAMWADHTVQDCASDVYDLRHPLVGSLRVQQHTLKLNQAPDQSLVAMTTEPGSPSATAVTLLAQAIGERA
ncbi:helix-turn-helix transcriptional regulator [Cryptosporangium japonicum]|uniref:Helix-turn-helix transcriptional regulator n=1 Tax=Cryptosporangium japonicum TaxID=80872 RepID=A0ABP3DWC7_9ACTN